MAPRTITLFMKIPSSISRCLFLATFIFLIACSDAIPTKVDFQIDNPTDQVISVSIDAHEYKIEPSSSKSVTLATGVHQMDTPLTGKVEFMVYGHKNGNGVLMNPTFSTYYLVSEVYAENDQARKGFQPYVKKVSIDGVEYEGPIQTLNGLFIGHRWTYGLDENFPETVEVYGAQKGSIKDKIFRKMELVAYMEDQYGEMGKYAASHQKPAVLQASYPNYEKPLHTFQYEPVEAAAKPLKELYTAYLQSTDTEQVQVMQKAYFDAQMAFTKATATLIIKMDVHDREAYNDFVSSMSNLFGQSARVLHPPQSPH